MKNKKSTIFAILASLIVLPNFLFLIVNFYMYLFDGWQLGEKAGNSLLVLICTAPLPIVLWIAREESK